MKPAKELRDKFKSETGMNWENVQGEPDIDYVIWLESLASQQPSWPTDAEIENKQEVELYHLETIRHIEDDEKVYFKVGFGMCAKWLHSTYHPTVDWEKFKVDFISVLDDQEPGIVMEDDLPCFHSDIVAIWVEDYFKNIH